MLDWGRIYLLHFSDQMLEMPSMGMDACISTSTAIPHPEVFERVRALYRRRGDACVHAHGGHFEHLLQHVLPPSVLNLAFQSSWNIIPFNVLFPVV
jgi:hypothetical protein